MAILECKECKGKVSDTAATCPHCGAPVPTQEPAQAAAPPATPTQKATGKKMSGWKITGLLFAAFIVVSCIGGMALEDPADGTAAASNPEGVAAASKPAAPKPLDKIEALTACQMLIKGLVDDPKTTDVPYIEGSDAGGDFNFKWSKDSKLVRVRNHLGIEVGLPAFCSVNKVNREFTQLNINGKNIPLK